MSSKIRYSDYADPMAVALTRELVKSERPIVFSQQAKPGTSYCETCESYKPNRGEKVCKGWKCGWCRE